MLAKDAAMFDSLGSLLGLEQPRNTSDKQCLPVLNNQQVILRTTQRSVWIRVSGDEIGAIIQTNKKFKEIGMSK